MEIKGKIYEIAETQEVKDNFRKREFILEYSENDKFTEYLKFETIQDKCEILDQYTVGAEVEVSFNLRGRAWVDKTGKKSYFNSLQAWRLKAAVEQPNQNNTGESSWQGNSASTNKNGGNSIHQNKELHNEDPGSIKSNTNFPPSDDDDLPF